MRFSILNRNLVLIENEKNKVYNALTDGLQSIDIAKQQKPFIQDAEFLLQSLRGYYKIKPWKNYSPRWQDWVLLNREYWSKPNSRDVVFTKELERLSQDPMSLTQPLTTLLQRHLLQNKKSADLAILKPIGLTAPALSTEKQKELFFEHARLNSLNLALENLWGIWIPGKLWLYSDFSVENQ